MKNFKYALAIKGSEEQVTSLIPKLIELGYKWGSRRANDFDEYPCLITDYGEGKGSLGFMHNNRGQLEVSASNPELVLALAAMVDDEDTYKGECFVCVTDYRDVTWGDCMVGDFKQITENGECTTIRWRKATKEEILEHFNKQPMEKKIIGYKLKEDCKQYEQAACKIGYSVPVTEFPLMEKEYHFAHNCLIAQELRKVGVLDLWFDPVYEPEKPKVEIVTLHCEGGTFKVEVSKEGIYYRPEDTWLDVSDIRTAIKGMGIFYRKSTGVKSTYTFTPSHIDSGCKKQVPVEDWKKVLDVRDKFQKE
jgi:hypothetical protein